MNGAERDNVVCEGHQELRDIVIETRRDVKYIRESLNGISTDLKSQGARIDLLESKEDQRKGESEATTRHAGIIAGLIATGGTIVSIGYTIWRGSGG